VADARKCTSTAQALWHLVDEHDIDALVVGMPYHKDGSRSRGCSLVERAADRWRAAWPRDVPLLFWDESWTTQLAAHDRGRAFRSDWRSHAAVACYLLKDMLRPGNERASAWLASCVRGRGSGGGSERSSHGGSASAARRSPVCR
jgi:RNase H-fold protein (predicted Holliday junction resolvase)